MKTLNYIISNFAVALVFLCSSCYAQEPDKAFVVADNFIRLHPDTVAYKNEAKSYRWNYEQGIVLEAFYQMWQKSDDDKYFNYIKKNIDYYITEDGSIKTYNISEYNIDNIAPGRQLLNLYEITKEQKYKNAADTLFKQLTGHPRTSEGGFWHKKIYPYQMWLDGLYMAQPFYTRYASLTGQVKIYDDVVKQFRLIRKNLYDAQSGLYYHGYDESKKEKWADPVKGTSPNFWGRSLGWFMMSMVDVLDYLPEKHEGYKEILYMFRELSENILKIRDRETKLWYQVPDKKDSSGNYIEASASMMFIYAFAKGAEREYLDKSFYEAAEESFKSAFEHLITVDSSGILTLNNVCSVAGLGGKPYRDGSFSYYINEPVRPNDFKGYGPLILSAVQLIKKSEKSYE
jgi:unsaturated rhamnogalacturonyl hydrolase